MKLKDFIESYEGFNWTTGEIVVIDQRKGYHKLGTLQMLTNIPSEIWDKMLEFNVYHWEHSATTMLIIL